MFSGKKIVEKNDQKIHHVHQILPFVKDVGSFPPKFWLCHFQHNTQHASESFLDAANGACV